MSDHDPLEIFREVTLREAQRIATPAALRKAVKKDIARHSRRAARGRRRSLVMLAAGLLTVGVGLGASALLLGGQPSRPDIGPACRSEPRLNSPAVALPPSADPLAACAELWRQGQLPTPDATGTPPPALPPLVACIGQGGVVEVYPGPSDLCDAIGLTPADPNPDPHTATVARLSSRIVEEVNLAECAPVAPVEERVRIILDELGLSTWSVVRTANTETADCVKAEIDPSASQIQLHPF